MAGEVAAVVAFAGAVSIALALALLVRGLHSPSRWILAALMVDYGVIALLRSVPEMLNDPVMAGNLHGSLWIARIVFISLHLAFAVVYPHWTLSPLRIAFLVLAFVPTGFLLSFTFANPGLLPTATESPNWYAQLLEILIVASHFPALWVFGRAWLKENGEFRGQFLYVLVAYLVWNLSYALERITSSFRDPDTFGPVLLSLGFTFLLLQIISIFIIGIGAIARAASSRRDRGHDARFVLLLFLIAPFVLFQFGDELGPLAYQGLVVPLLFYGGAKYQLVALPLQLKQGIRGSVLGIVGLAIVFVIEESVQFYLGQTFGYIGGVAVAAGVVLIFAPLRRFARRISDGAMPNVNSSPEYLAKRRLELYRVALDGMIRDHIVDPKEAAALAGLRRELGVSMKEHDTIEQMLRGGRRRLKAVLATPTPA